MPDFTRGGNCGLASFYPGVTIVTGKNGLPHRPIIVASSQSMMWFSVLLLIVTVRRGDLLCHLMYDVIRHCDPQAIRPPSNTVHRHHCPEETHLHTTWHLYLPHEALGCSSLSRTAVQSAVLMCLSVCLSVCLMLVSSTPPSRPNKVGQKCPPVRPQNVSSISVKFGMHVEVDEWCMTVCSMTRSRFQMVPIRDV